jgi:adenylylsulfate kinase
MMDNLFKQDALVSPDQRRELMGHNSFVIWFTGLSGSGKSTVASHLQVALHSQSVKTYVLDGDNIRLGLNTDLDFSDNGRIENIRRISEVAKLITDAGLVTLCSFISPFEADRKKAKDIIGESNFIEVYVKCDLAECEKRDVKGLYAKARAGKIKNFTGIDSPYEVPKSPTIELDTSTHSIQECVNKIIKTINNKLNVSN